jgi:hypothetical protein
MDGVLCKKYDVSSTRYSRMPPSRLVPVGVKSNSANESWVTNAGSSRDITKLSTIPSKGHSSPCKENLTMSKWAGSMGAPSGKPLRFEHMPSGHGNGRDEHTDVMRLHMGGVQEIQYTLPGNLLLYAVRPSREMKRRRRHVADGQEWRGVMAEEMLDHMDMVSASRWTSPSAFFLVVTF